jgi:hypothetical protein
MLAKLLCAEGGSELVDKAAVALLPALRATGRFIDFVLEFMPHPPSQRISEHLRLPWDDPTRMKGVFAKVYDHRSRALHDGTPFPRPMCSPSMVPSEIPECLAAAADGGSWTREDAPMLLHVFERITRGALINWWRKEVSAV